MSLIGHAGTIAIPPPRPAPPWVWVTSWPGMPPFDSRVKVTTPTASRWAQRGGIDVLTWELFERMQVDAMITTRHGGVSVGPYGSLNLALHVGDKTASVLENRSRSATAMGASLEDMIFAEQVHGNRVAVVARSDRGRGSLARAGAVPGCDALVTAESGPVLAVLVADCAPVVLADPDARVVACAHAGWRGALGGVLEATIGAMESVGAERRRMVAGIGPAVAAVRYEVGDDVADAARLHLGAVDSCLWPGRPGHFFFDLAEAVRMILLRSGLEEEHVASAGVDTGPSGPFFSARADGRCGRFALLARIRP